MGLLFRGIVWFGLYVVLAVLPLGMALAVDPLADDRALTLELSAGLGLLAYPLMAMQFALVTRLQSASRPFGTDALMQFHRQLGIAGVGFALAHALLLTGHGIGLAEWNPLAGSATTRSGALALWALVIIAVTSLARRHLRLSYEVWDMIHFVGAVVAIGAMLWHVLAVSGYAGPAPMRWLLVAYVGLVAALVLRHRIVGPVLRWRRPWEVVDNRDEGASTRTLRLRPRGHAGFELDPGQFAWIGTRPWAVGGAQHPITISSSAERPDDGSIELSIKALGDWSREVVPRLEAGQRVWVDGPYGVLTPEREPGQGLVLIAGGIGISPMRSILLTMRDRGDRRPVVLFYGAARRERAPFMSELETLRRHIALELVPVYEEPDPDWSGERGFITKAMVERHLPPYAEHYQFFICGPVPMTDKLERILVDIGIPTARIHSERFDLV